MVSHINFSPVKADPACLSHRTALSTKVLTKRFPLLLQFHVLCETLSLVHPKVGKKQDFRVASAWGRHFNKLCPD